MSFSYEFKYTLMFWEEYIEETYAQESHAFIICTKHQCIYFQKPNISALWCIQPSHKVSTLLKIKPNHFMHYAKTITFVPKINGVHETQ